MIIIPLDIAGLDTNLEKLTSKQKAKLKKSIGNARAAAWQRMRNVLDPRLEVDMGKAERVIKIDNN